MVFYFELPYWKKFKVKLPLIVIVTPQLMKPKMLKNQTKFIYKKSLKF